LFSVFPQDGKKQMLSGEGERSGRRTCLGTCRATEISQRGGKRSGRRICLGTGPGDGNQPGRREEIRKEDLSADMPGQQKKTSRI